MPPSGYRLARAATTLPRAVPLKPILPFAFLGGNAMIKILLALVFLVLPAMMSVIVGAAMIQVMRTLSQQMFARRAVLDATRF